MNADDEPTFDEIGSALAFVARDQALLVEQCEHLVMSLPPSPGLQADLNARRRRAHALGRAHALVQGLDHLALNRVCVAG